MLSDINKVFLAKCEICQQDSFDIVFEKVRPIKFSDNTIIFNQKILLCQSCGFIFVEKNPTYSENNLSNYYRNIDRTPVDYTLLSDSDIRLKNAKLRFQFISQLVITDKSLLEIGYGDGISALYFQKKGFSVEGIDPSEGYQVDNYLHAEGVVTHKIDFFNFQEDKKYNVIATYLVLEHIYDIKKFITKVSSILLNDGVFVIEVPDVSLYPEFISDALLTHEHLSHFTIGSLTSLMNNYGFELVTSTSPGNKYGFSLLAAFKKSKKIIPLALKNEYTNTLKYFSTLKNNINKYDQLLVTTIKNKINGLEAVGVYGIGELGKKLVNIIQKTSPNIEIVLFEQTESKIGTEFLHIKIKDLSSITYYKNLNIFIGSSAFFEIMSDQVYLYSPTAICHDLHQEVILKIKKQH